MDVKEFENKRWEREDQALQWRHKAALAMIASGTVLDVGSGDGLLLALLRDKGVTGKGLDLSEEGVRKANGKGLDTQVFDFTNKLPFPDKSFDTVVMLDILEHLYDPAALVREAARVSRRDVAIGVPNFSSFVARLQTLIGRIPENNQPKKGHVFWFNHRVLLNMCSKENLQLTKLDSNTVYFIPTFLKKIFPNLFSLSFVATFSRKG
jgi:methionine biosynthesis protein MetW